MSVDFFASRPARWATVAISIPLMAACHSRGNVVPDAAPAPSLFAKPAKESERARDELWKRAADDDPVDLARLADRDGVGGLLEGLEEGGPLGLVALKALPFADDAEAAYQRLGEIVRQIEPGESPVVLDTIVGIALRPRRQVEPVDPPGAHACALALLTLAENKSLAKAIRARSITALRLLAERGAVDAGAIPTDLDAR
jgi:hypothetical protein